MKLELDRVSYAYAETNAVNAVSLRVNRDTCKDSTS